MEKKQLEQRVAEKLLEYFSFITVSDTGLVYRKVDYTYYPLSQTTLEFLITDTFNELNLSYSRTKRNIAIDLFKMLTFKNVKDIEYTTKNTLNLINGVYYFDEVDVSIIKDNEVIHGKGHFKYHPVYDYYPFTQLPVTYDPEAQCPNIDKFITEVFGEDKVDLVYEFIGYMLLPHVKYQRAMMMLGSGKNGKTTFLEMLIRFLGSDNIAMIPLQELDDRFSMINLKNKFGNIVPDIPSKEIVDTGNAKRIITDDTLSGSIKNIQGIFSFKNRCKMIFACNQLPRVRDKTPAFFRRWVLFVCDAIFEKNKDIDIMEKLCTSQEFSGLLNQAILGIERLKENNGFPDTQEEVKDIWNIESNPIGDFIITHCIHKKGVEIRSKELFEAFNEYRANKGLDLFDGRKIGYWLRQYGIMGIQRREDDELDNYGNPKWYTYYQGIDLKSKRTKNAKLEIWMEEND